MSHPVPRKATAYTVHKGTRYRATLLLGGFESLASNGMIARKLSGYGFQDVRVTGQGRVRQAIGIWAEDDTSVEMPKQVTTVVAA